MTVEAMELGRRRARAAVETRWIFPTIPVAAAALAFVWLLHGEMQRLYGMTSSAWDLAYDQQVIWNIANGNGFYSSFARANFLGIHFELIFVVLAAVEKFWPNPAVLLIFSSAGLAATAPAAYLFFRAILPAGRAESPWLAAALSAPIPFWVSIQDAARDFFHPENMALAFALVAAWAGIKGHRVTMWAFCLLTLTCKEDQVYTVAVVGILVSQFGAESVRRHWRFVVYLAGAWFLIGTGIVQQHFRDGGYTDFVYYRWLVGLDPSIPLDPANFLGAFVRPGALAAVAIVLAGLCALPLLAPRWLLLVVPPYLADVLSGHTPQNTLNLHYILLLLFPLIVAAGVGGRRLLEQRRLRPALAAGAAVPALVMGLALGHFPPALQADDALFSRPDQYAQLMQAAAVIPAGAHVNADDGLAVWFANRLIINDFPDYMDATCYIVLDDNAFISGPTHPDQRYEAITTLQSSGRQLLYDDGHFQVWSPVGGPQPLR